MPQLPGHLAEILGDSLGVAAVLLVVGWVLLRWQQDRQRFSLMQTALEKGITQFPNAPPFWLVSLRQGMTMLALGGALIVVGAGVFIFGKQVPMPASAMLAENHAGPRERGGHNSVSLWEEGPPPRQRPRPGNQGPPGRFEDGPDRMPPPRDRGGDEEQEQRPPANPELERWHHAQIEEISGLVTTGAGVILVIVGVMRVTFARTERFYATDPTRLDGGT